MEWEEGEEEEYDGGTATGVAEPPAVVTTLVYADDGDGSDGGGATPTPRALSAPAAGAVAVASGDGPTRRRGRTQRDVRLDRRKRTTSLALRKAARERPVLRQVEVGGASVHTRTRFALLSEHSLLQEARAVLRALACMEDASASPALAAEGYAFLTFHCPRALHGLCPLSQSSAQRHPRRRARLV